MITQSDRIDFVHCGQVYLDRDTDHWIEITTGPLLTMRRSGGHVIEIDKSQALLLIDLFHCWIETDDLEAMLPYNTKAFKGKKLRADNKYVSTVCEVRGDTLRLEGEYMGSVHKDSVSPLIPPVNLDDYRPLTRVQWFQSMAAGFPVLYDGEVWDIASISLHYVHLSQEKGPIEATNKMTLEESLKARWAGGPNMYQPCGVKK